MHHGGTEPDPGNSPTVLRGTNQPEEEMKAHNNPKIVAAAMLFIAMMGIAPAVMIELSPADLQDGASLIVSGTVSGMKSQWDETHSNIYTDVTVSVSSLAKGEAGNEIVVRVPGGEVGDVGQVVSDMPRFTLGEQTTLCLAPTADPSVFEVYGGYQGKAPGNPPTDHTWSYSGYHWNSTSILYYDNLVSTWRSAVGSAKAAWNNAGSVFRIQWGGTRVNSAPVRDYCSVVYRKNMGAGGILAQTTVWCNLFTKHVSECDMVYNTYYTWSILGGASYYDVQNTGTHEFGHFLVLNDLYDSDATEQTMYGYASKGETQKRTLESGDIYGIWYIYGTFDNSRSAGGVAEAGIEPAAAAVALRVFPNPSTGRTVLSYSLPNAGSASIKVSDVSGATVLTKAFQAGRMGKVSLDASGLRNGVYLVRVAAGGFSAEQKLVVQR